MANWPVLVPGSALLHKWIIPDTGRHFVLRNGSAGFLLAHNALWFHEKVERLDLGQWDEWGYAYRKISGSDQWSNHARGTATDLNATRHPLGVATRRTFTTKQVNAIHGRLDFYKGTIRWGGDYQSRPDGMHFEIVGDLAECERLARSLLNSPRGGRILKSNPSQKAVIRS